MSIDALGGFWTDFADGAVLLPVGFAVAVLLVMLGQRRSAGAWTVAVGGVWGVVLVLKLAGYAILAAVPNSPLARIDLVTPSGHVASATVIYAGLAGLLVRWPGTPAARIAAVALFVALVSGVTRVTTHEHSAAEAIVGAVVGLAGAGALAGWAIKPLPSWRPVPVLLAVAAIITVQFGNHAPWERMIRSAARQAIGDW